MKNRTFRTMVLSALLGLSLASTACIGPFNAVGRLHTWNRSEFENRWAGEGVYLVLRVLPVYALCFVGDVLIFNSIEFWGGTNPVDPPDRATVEALRAADAARAAEASK